MPFPTRSPSWPPVGAESIPLDPSGVMADTTAPPGVPGSASRKRVRSNYGRRLRWGTALIGPVLLFAGDAPPRCERPRRVQVGLDDYEPLVQ